MNSNFSYRSIGLMLTVVFALFNVGLPVVVASCPMPKAEGSALCAMCYDDLPAGSVSVTTERNASCCATKFAADRNTTEFLQAQSLVEKAKPAVVQNAVHPLLLPEAAFRPLPSRCACDASPHARDIPIFNSSLLI